MMSNRTLVERAHDALGEAFAEAMKTHFVGFLGQVDDSGEVKVATGHFRNGMRDLKAAYEAAETIIDEIFGVLA
jgi:hypothetical protein